jgi:signal transduction histidine kinase
MVAISKQFWGIILLSILSITTASVIPAAEKTKNVLLINSYHEGYLWTDSLTSGIISALKSTPDITIHIENLNSKQFGKSNFEIEKNYIQAKYSGIVLDGILVTDNDALDFAFQYDQDLFPNTPAVFAGISNPEDYPLEGSQFYGFKETASIDNVLLLVKKILPEAKKLLVLTDFTTTGQIYRKEFTKQAAQIKDFSVVFPKEINLDSIYKKVSSEKDYDAIYYIGINQDENGRLVNFVPILEKITKLAKVPLFNNDPLFNGIGIIGGLYQSGKKHGNAAARLLVQLMDKNSTKPAKRFDTTGYNYFFDWDILKKYNIPSGRIPAGSQVINQPNIFNKKYFFILISVLAFLLFIVLLLTYTVRKTKKAEKKIRKQFKKIQTQNKELEEAHEQLNNAVSDLENTNDRLKDTNVNLLEAKKKAEESDNLKSAFLANVSHEIRTPLNSIVGFSSLLSDADLSEETRNSYIELIDSNTESLLVLIDEILDLSKIEAQQLVLKKLDFNMDELISELFRIFSHGNINLRVELRVGQIIEGKSLFIFSDRVRVKQIFINLISNAFKFTDSGFIEIGYFLSEKKEVAFYVKDTGIGIKQEHYQAIFTRFRKLNENSSRVYRGTGLGLAITQKLVELLGGRIWIESETGKGSTFFFTLQDCRLKEIGN